MKKKKFGSLNVGVIDLDELKKLKKEDIAKMWNQVADLQWKNNNKSPL